jgi:hypothetical protein
LIHYDKFCNFFCDQETATECSTKFNINAPNKPYEREEKLKYLDMALSNGSNWHEGIGVQLV